MRLICLRRKLIYNRELFSSLWRFHGFVRSTYEVRAIMFAGTDPAGLFILSRQESGFLNVPRFARGAYSSWQRNINSIKSRRFRMWLHAENKLQMPKLEYDN